ncbi:hypothetical protein MRB56_11450 [Halomonas cupida]|uniref:hypothetical protein n=1 Tax=Halomonas cupida TaxID=44933 RepID=UPI0039B63610
MSSRLLAECIDQLDQYGFSPEFHAYFMRQKLRLMGSADVAAGLVVLATQEEAYSETASQLLGILLDEARMGLENDSSNASDFLEAVEVVIQSGLEAGALQHTQLMILAALYRRAALPVPQALMLDPASMPPPPETEDIDISKSLEEIAADVLSDGGSANDLFNVIDEMLASVPEDPRSALAHHLATMGSPVFERCALYMLLAGTEAVQEAIVAGLHERLVKATLSQHTLSLLPMIRGWFAEGPIRSGLDGLLREARRRPTPAQADTDVAPIQEIVASIVDGAGTQSIGILLKQRTEVSVAMILLKAGHGIKDAFVVPSEDNNGADVEPIVAHLREEADAIDISYSTLERLLEGAFHEGLDNNGLPAPGILDVVEACHLFELRPQKLALDELFDLADPENEVRGASSQGLGRWINDREALSRLEYLTDSWFEDTRETRQIVASGRTDRGIETAIWKYLESRRELWARRFLQTAIILHEDERLREWKTLTASAHGLISGRALKRIPLMEDMVHMTIEAAIAEIDQSEQ